MCRSAANMGIIDIEADRLVVFTRGNDPNQLFNNMQQPQGQESKEMEFFLSGNVEIREKSAKTPQDSRKITANEVYYDVNRNVAIALQATLEMRQAPKSVAPVTASGQPSDLQVAIDPFYIKADELLRTSLTTYEVVKAEMFSSKLPSDPDLQVFVTKATIEEKTILKTNIFGKPVIDRKTGKQVEDQQTMVYAHDLLYELDGVPFFYLPYAAFDARNPLGPVNNIVMGYNHIFGAMLGFSVDMFQLLGIQKDPGMHGAPTLII